MKQIKSKLIKVLASCAIFPSVLVAPLSIQHNISSNHVTAEEDVITVTEWMTGEDQDEAHSKYLYPKNQDPVDDIRLYYEFVPKSTTDIYFSESYSNDEPILWKSGKKYNFYFNSIEGNLNIVSYSYNGNIVLCFLDLSKMEVGTLKLPKCALECTIMIDYFFNKNASYNYGIECLDLSDVYFNEGSQMSSGIYSIYSEYDNNPDSPGKGNGGLKKIILPTSTPCKMPYVTNCKNLEEVIFEGNEKLTCDFDISYADYSKPFAYNCSSIKRIEFQTNNVVCNVDNFFTNSSAVNSLEAIYINADDASSSNKITFKQENLPNAKVYFGPAQSDNSAPSEAETKYATGLFYQELAKQSDLIASAGWNQFADKIVLPFQTPTEINIENSPTGGSIIVNDGGWTSGIFYANLVTANNYYDIELNKKVNFALYQENGTDPFNTEGITIVHESDNENHQGQYKIVADPTIAAGSYKFKIKATLVDEATSLNLEKLSNLISLDVNYKNPEDQDYTLNYESIYYKVYNSEDGINGIDFNLTSNSNQTNPNLDVTWNLTGEDASGFKLTKDDNDKNQAKLTWDKTHANGVFNLTISATIGNITKEGSFRLMITYVAPTNFNITYIDDKTINTTINTASASEGVWVADVKIDKYEQTNIDAYGVKFNNKAAELDNVNAVTIKAAKNSENNFGIYVNWDRFTTPVSGILPIDITYDDQVSKSLEPINFNVTYQDADVNVQNLISEEIALKVNESMDPKDAVTFTINNYDYIDKSNLSIVIDEASSGIADHWSISYGDTVNQQTTVQLNLTTPYTTAENGNFKIALKQGGKTIASSSVINVSAGYEEPNVEVNTTISGPINITVNKSWEATDVAQFNITNFNYVDSSALSFKISDESENIADHFNVKVNGGTSIAASNVIQLELKSNFTQAIDATFKISLYKNDSVIATSDVITLHVAYEPADVEINTTVTDPITAEVGQSISDTKIADINISNFTNAENNYSIEIVEATDNKINDYLAIKTNGEGFSSTNEVLVYSTKVIDTAINGSFKIKFTASGVEHYSSVINVIVNYPAPVIENGRIDFVNEGNYSYNSNDSVSTIYIGGFSIQNFANIDPESVFSAEIYNLPDEIAPYCSMEVVNREKSAYFDINLKVQPITAAIISQLENKSVQFGIKINVTVGDNTVELNDPGIRCTLDFNYAAPEGFAFNSAANKNKEQNITAGEGTNQYEFKAEFTNPSFIDPNTTISYALDVNYEWLSIDENGVVTIDWAKYDNSFNETNLTFKVKASYNDGTDHEISIDVNWFISQNAKELSTGAIAGISVGSVAVVAGTGGAAAFILKKKR